MVEARDIIGIAQRNTYGYKTQISLHIGIHRMCRLTFLHLFCDNRVATIALQFVIFGE